MQKRKYRLVTWYAIKENSDQKKARESKKDTSKCKNDISIHLRTTLCQITPRNLNKPETTGDVGINSNTLIIGDSNIPFSV